MNYFFSHRIKFACSLILCLQLFSPNSLAGYIKCWKNDQGMTECGNKIPIEHTDKAVRFIDQDGMTRKVKERAKTAEEKALEKQQQEQAREALRQQLLQEKHDKILLDTYLQIDELLVSVKQRSEYFNSRIEAEKTALEKKQAGFTRLIKQAADIERSGRAIPDKLKSQLELNRTERNAIKSQIDSIRQEKSLKNEELAKDVKRYMILTANRRYASLGNDHSARKLVSIMLDCPHSQCKKMVDRAKQFISDNASTSLVYKNADFVITDTPQKAQDIAMGFVLLKKDNENKLVFKIRCTTNNEGRELCQSDKITRLLAEFKQQVTN